MTDFVPNIQSGRRQFLLGTVGATTVAFLPIAPAFAASTPRLGLGRNQRIDLDWRFFKGDGTGFEAPDFDDSVWRRVDLPHDWSIETLPQPLVPGPKPIVIGPFTKNALGGTATGFTEGGTGWYRKHFQVNSPSVGRVEVVFDGVYMNSEVWMNGRRLGSQPNGYTEFAFDLTPYLVAGDNVLAVRVRNEGKNSRWYSGSGIYRHVALDVYPDKARIERHGTSVVTRRISGSEAVIGITVSLLDAKPGMTLTMRIKGPDGKLTWKSSDGADPTNSRSATIAAAKLWSPDSPSLYSLECELRRGREVIDRTTTSFGIRIVAFSPDNGMTINGSPVKLRGGCIHHAHGLIGAASFDCAEERKVRLLKARGYNAVRPSHNPFSKAFLDACDQLGMMVVAETFDAWQSPKLPDDYSVFFADQWKSDLATIVLGQRNHPSIVMWSIGNEIPDRNTPEGVKNQWLLAQAVHEMDPYRPVTAAVNDFAGREVMASDATARPGYAGKPDQASFMFLDVAGYNYKYPNYIPDHARYPGRIIYGTESFPKDVFAIWDLTDRSPFVLGDFVWTSIDYLGEAGIGGSSIVSMKYASYGASPSAWPTINSSCGDIDLIGNQKTQSLARDVVWGLSDLEVAVQRPVPDGKVEVLRPWGWSDERSSWTWPGAEGKTLALRVFTSGDRVEVRLNGKTVESRSVTPADLKHIEFAVAYVPGTLELVAYTSAKMIGRKKLETVSAPALIEVTPERKNWQSGRDQLTYLQIEVRDSEGRHSSDVAVELSAEISGPAELIGFGSANPNAIQGFQGTTSQTYDGRALLIMRGTGKPGTVNVKVSSKGLQGGRASIRLI